MWSFFSVCKKTPKEKLENIVSFFYYKTQKKNVLGEKKKVYAI